jgi:hypothetical protein
MKALFFDCQLFTAVSAACSREAFPCYERVTELEASFWAVRSGGSGGVMSRVLELLDSVREGFGRRSSG